MLTATALRDEALEFAAGIDPDAVPLPEVTAVWAAVVEAVKVLTGVSTLLARRVEDAEAWCAAACTASRSTTQSSGQKPSTPSSKNSSALCEHHHDLKTRFGWELVEGTGPRPMVPPEDPRHPRNRPPPRK